MNDEVDQLKQEIRDLKEQQKASAGIALGQSISIIGFILIGVGCLALAALVLLILL